MPRRLCRAMKPTPQLKRRQEALHAARQHRVFMEAERARCREALSAALLQYCQGRASSADIRKREIQAINADRANKVESGGERRPGPSRIDRAAFYSAGGNGNDYARKQHRYGSHHRATALTPGGALQAPGPRGTVRVPSEQ